jgi:hypothetical protein
MSLDHDLNKTNSYDQMMGIAQAAHKGSQSESPDKHDPDTFIDRYNAVYSPVNRASQSSYDLKSK